MLRVLAVMGVLALTGCRASAPEYMREVSPMRQLKAPVDQALVVFVRATTDEKSLEAHVMDDTGAFLGTAVAGGHFSVVRPPGRQTFIVFTGNFADALVADLAVGLVYFIEVSPSTSGPMRFTLRASARGTDIFPFKEAWLEETTQFRVDGPAAKARMAAETTQRSQKVVADANDRLRTYSGKSLTEHTLAQTDGHSKVGIPGRVAYATAAPLPVPIAVPSTGRSGPPPPVPAPAPASPQATGFIPEEFPAPQPGPAPDIIPDTDVIKRGYLKGTLVRVKLKNGATWIGEVVKETRNELKLAVGGGGHQVIFFDEMQAVEQISNPR